MGESCEQGRVVIGEQAFEAMLMDRRGRSDAGAMEQLRRNKVGMGLEGQYRIFEGRRASVWARAVGQGSGGGGSWGQRGWDWGFPAAEVRRGLEVWPGEQVASGAASQIQRLGPAP